MRVYRLRVMDVEADCRMHTIAAMLQACVRVKQRPAAADYTSAHELFIYALSPAVFSALRASGAVRRSFIELRIDGNRVESILKHLRHYFQRCHKILLAICA